MLIQEMHYEFKFRYNKNDSQQNRNLIVPEIDRLLNEAQDLFVEMVAHPRSSNIGFEGSTRNINDIRTVVIDQKPEDAILTKKYDESSYIIELPKDYWFLAKAKPYASKGRCKDVVLRGIEVQHDDEHEASTFDRSSFEWRVTNMRFNREGLRFFTDKTFTINKVALEYIRRPKRIHNAADYEGGTYEDMDGSMLTGRVNSELPEAVHTKIVDIAVLVASGNITLPDYNMKQAKLRMT